MAVDFKDYYQTLGIGRDATDDEIKSAFRKLARKYHPDVAKDKKTAEEKFKEINEAHEVLGDPVKRTKYDQLGARWQDGAGASRGSGGSGPGPSHQEFHFDGTGFSDFFEQFFGGGAQAGFSRGDYEFGGDPTRRANGSRRGNDIEGDILITLEEALHGTVRPISLRITHPETGAAETRSFQVRIPPGATDGRRIRVPKQGGVGSGGGVAGDLYLRVRHAAHPDLHAREADLYFDLDVSAWDAVLGAEIEIDTLDGSIKLRIPPGTENGRKLRLRGRGLPIGKGGGRGDFYVVVTVKLPVQLSEPERAAWENLRAVSSSNPVKQGVK